MCDPKRTLHSRHEHNEIESSTTYGCVRMFNTLIAQIFFSGISVISEVGIVLHEGIHRRLCKYYRI